jgi:two-component system, OmpR family, phosphate regulon response regulator PhoB
METNQKSNPLTRVLVVEDETEIRDLIELHLRRQGFETNGVGSPLQAIASLKEANYDLIILDWMMPGGSGIELVQFLRECKKLIPILMVTAKSDPSDIVTALEQGADDYVVKPFIPSVLMARVRALLRRTGPESVGSSESAEILSEQGLVMNLKTHDVICRDVPVKLTVSEFKLLQTLMISKGKVFTRDQLIDNIQGEGVAVIGRTVDTHVFGLRKKLLTCGELIETIRGIGYRFKAD